MQAAIKQFFNKKWTKRQKDVPKLSQSNKKYF